MQRVERRPQVVAHRGSSYDKPEHTLSAYVAALDTGVEGLECDVRLTADGHLVCVHDRRVDRTTNGHGVVSTMDLAQLDELDFGSWKTSWGALGDEVPEVPEVDEDTRRVLTLRRLVETVRDYDRPVELAIETKHPTRYAGLVERRLIELLESVGWAGAGSPVRVMSFSPVALTRVQRLAPDLEVVLLLDRQYPWKVATSVLGPGWIAGPGVDLLREHPRLGRRLRKNGRRIHVWTVNTQEDLEMCVALGAEAVITDDPQRILKQLHHPASFGRGA
jgi:glycerophosphoryl diester phosphodiesterase